MHAWNVHLALQHAQEYPDNLLTSLSRLFAGLRDALELGGVRDCFPMGSSSRNMWTILRRFAAHYSPGLHADGS